MHPSSPHEDSAARDANDSAVLQRLVENHAQFLAFLTRRVGSREAAEDILQDAFARSLNSAATLRDGESAVAWFYRLLRNALIDHWRHRGAEQRALAAVVAERGDDEPATDDALQAQVCTCVTGLLDTLKPEYAAALRRVDLEEARVSDFAEEAGISPNLASVRLHRARLALKRQLELSCGTCATHGCLDCTCDASPGRDCSLPE